MDNSQRRELNDGIWRSHGGYELALSPLLFGLLGWWIDGRLGTSPLFVIVLAIAAFAGVVIKTFYTYRYMMERVTSERAEVRAARSSTERANGLSSPVDENASGAAAEGAQ